MSVRSTKSADESRFVVSNPSEMAARNVPPLKENDFVESEMVEFSVSPRPSASLGACADAPTEPSIDRGSAGGHLPEAARLPSGAGSPRFEAAIAGQCVIPNESITWMRTQLSLRRSRHSFSGTKIFLIVTLIATPFAYIFAFKSFPSRIDIAAASMTPSIDSRSITHVSSPQTMLPLAETADFDAWPNAQLAVQVSSTGAAIHSDDTPNVMRAKMAALQPVPDIERTTIANDTIDHGSGVAADLSSATETLRFRQAQTGVWTYCTVNLIPSGQIAVQKATSYRSCISAGKKCAGTRRYADIQYFDRPTWASSTPLELCNAES